MGIRAIGAAFGAALFWAFSWAAAADFSGTYTSTFGELRLHHVGDFVIGDYADRGVMVGKVSGNAVSGGFTNGTGAGTFAFRWADDSKGFTGTYKYGETNAGSPWNGQRTGDAPQELVNFSLDSSPTRTISNKRDVFDGVYDSPFGRIELIQKDLFLIGDYGSRGVMAGMWDGSGFVGRFTNGNRAGWFDFRFLSTDGSFRTGRWGWAVGTAQGQWKLTKVAGATPQIDLLQERGGQIIRPDNSLNPARPQARQRLEGYDTTGQNPVRTAELVLPGDTTATTVHYEVINGLAVLDGDMILGRESDLKTKYAAPASEIPADGRSGDFITRRQPLNVMSNPDLLWKNGVIPFDFDKDVPAYMRTRVRDAAKRLSNETNLSVVERNGQKDYVRIFYNDESCNSWIGRQGGEQAINVVDWCEEVSVMHEFLHAAGFTHEQSRRDRDAFVEVRSDKIRWWKGHNFRTIKDSTPLGPYDYGSVMHYHSLAFAKEDCTSDCETIIAKQPIPAGVTMGQRDGLSAQDVQGVNFVYPASVGVEAARGWGPGAYPTAVATGDVDGDGDDEFVIARRSTVNGRAFLYDYQNGAEVQLEAFGTGWGRSAYAVDVAMGDVDGDGRDEIAIVRYATSGNRYHVYDDAQAGFALMHAGGTGWGQGAWGTAIALGDVDGDGRAELAVGRRSPVNARFYIYDDATTGFAALGSGGSGWGQGAVTRGLAFGDVDNDGREELGIVREHDSNHRYSISELDGTTWKNEVHLGGSGWGPGAYGTTIAFGNVDSDPEEEMLVGRQSSVNNRFYLLDDKKRGFAQMEAGGAGWGPGYWTVGVDLADFDGDGTDELLVARNARENGRLFVYDDARTSYAAFNVTTSIWPNGVGGTDAAFGDVDGDGDEDIIMTRKETIEGRTRFEVIIAQ
ncbi:MAG: M12 family metallopeptidase [Pseudomonadota bacterium]